MLRKKSQIHMLETIVVLAIFFILVILGFVFYSKMFKSGVETQKDEAIQLNAIEIAQRAATLPELQCSQENVVKDNCIDLQKLVAAKSIMELNEIHYYDMFSFSKITVEKIYPTTHEWTIYDRQFEQNSRTLEKEEYDYWVTTNIPITIFDSVENKNDFGVMKVELFSK
jgi:type II secretory pathway pseudopilin PulG